MPKDKKVPCSAEFPRTLGCPLVALDREITLAITGVASFGASDGRVLVTVEWVAGAVEIGTGEARLENGIQEIASYVT